MGTIRKYMEWKLIGNKGNMFRIYEEFDMDVKYGKGMKELENSYITKLMN